MTSCETPLAVSALAILSKADMCGKSAKFWNAMPTPRDSGGASVTSRPASAIVPESQVSTPAMRRKSTVFPDPDGPKTQTISPGSSSSVTRSRTTLSLKRLQTPRISSCGIHSPLHRAERQAFDEIALGVERKRERRRHRKHDRCCDCPY